MKIEFDPAKRLATIEARGIDMADAGKVFGGTTLTVNDDRTARPATSRSGDWPEGWSSLSGLRAARRGTPYYSDQEGQ